jgi:proteasome assembly chaperone (PAC2) family protein
MDKATDWLNRTCKTLKAMNNSEDRSKYIKQRISDLKKLDNKKEPQASEPEEEDWTIVTPREGEQTPRGVQEQGREELR